MSFVANPSATNNAVANSDVPMSVVTNPAATILSVATPKPAANPYVPMSPEVFRAAEVGGSIEPWQRLFGVGDLVVTAVWVSATRQTNYFHSRLVVTPTGGPYLLDEDIPSP